MISVVLVQDCSAGVAGVTSLIANLVLPVSLTGRPLNCDRLDCFLLAKQIHKNKILHLLYLPDFCVC